MLNKVEILVNRLLNNIKQVKVQNKGSLVCAMVKANAYGMGDKAVVKTLNKWADYFGVACFFEAKEIKRYTNKKILIVGPLEHIKLSTKFSYTISSIDDVLFLCKLNKKFNVHLKVNSGMNRYGFSSVTKFKRALKIIENSKLNLEGIFTHYATADNYVERQTEVFKKFLNCIKNTKFKPIIHADNSAVNAYKNHHFDMVRIGFNLYNNTQKSDGLVERIYAKITQINHVKTGELVGYNRRFVADKNTKIAVVSVGYADGFLLEYLGIKLCVKNTPCRVVNVCMDCFMLDVTNVKISVGEFVEILSDKNNPELYANHTKSSSYQVLTNFSNIRAKREIKNK
ncbi:MAG: alanine racemase [Clostridia bacterium]|nr:alanine racemase [Clostridia bacterium]